MSDRTHTGQSAETLRCVECAAMSTVGIGWRALLTAGDEEAEDNEEVAVYCSQCGGAGVRGAAMSWRSVRRIWLWAVVVVAAWCVSFVLYTWLGT